MNHLKRTRWKQVVARCFLIGQTGLSLFLDMGETVFAKSNKSGCEQRGEVSAVYETKGSKVNGYGLKSGNVIVNYETKEPLEGCANVGCQYVGITDKVEVPEVDASEGNVSKGGYSCNGHHSEQADWRHWFGRSGSILYGMAGENVGSVVVKEEEYKRCHYVIAGPSVSFGDGIGKDGSFGWVVLYKKLPKEISAEGIDDMSPEITLQATPTGVTAVNAVTGKTYGTTALLRAVITDRHSRPHKTKTIRFQYPNGNFMEWLGVNTQNKVKATAETTVLENGVYYAQAQDQLENKGLSERVEVDCIDRQAPVALVAKEVNEKVVAGGKEWTATNVTISVSAEDEGVGLAQNPYCFDEVTWTDNTNYVVSQNGAYHIRVRDALGNVTDKSIFIQNFDKQAPTAVLDTIYEDGVTIGTKTWSAKQATIKVQAQDTGCGLDSEPYSYDGGATWTNENTCSFTENGEKVIKIRDCLHNTLTKYVVVDGIDKTAPMISDVQIADSAGENKNRVVKVTAFDNADGCGLDETPFSFDGGNSWTDINEIMVTETTVLNIQVRDRLHNTATMLCPVKGLQRETDGEEKEAEKENAVKKENGISLAGNDEKQKPDQGESLEDKHENKLATVTENMQDTESRQKTRNSDDLQTETSGSVETEFAVNGIKEGKTPATKQRKFNRQQENEIAEKITGVSENDLWVGEKVENADTDTKTYQVDIPVLKDEREPIVPGQYKKKVPSKRALFVALSAASVLLLTLLFFLWYAGRGAYYRVVLYARQNGRYRKLGNLKVNRKEENLRIEIPEELLYRVTERFYRIQMSRSFVKSHDGEEIFLLVEERMIKKQVERQIDFYF